MHTDRVRSVAPDYIGMGVDAGLRRPQKDLTYKDALGFAVKPFDASSHSYMSLQGEGRATLDAVRAGRSLELILAGLTAPDRTRSIGTNNTFLVTGPSRGGHAALSTGEVHAAGYAPELDLRAVIAGNAPGRFRDLANF